MDAQVAYRFHTERQNHPEKFKNQFHNQVGSRFYVPLLFSEHYRYACSHSSWVLEISFLGLQEPDVMYFACFTAVSVCKDHMFTRLVLCILFPSYL